MQYRTFGRLGWPVSELGYGMWGMGGWSESDDDESRQALQLAVDLGCTFFDTAWGYGAGHSEGLLGELVRANPEKSSIRPPRYRPRTSNGPHGADTRLTRHFHPLTSAHTRKRA